MESGGKVSQAGERTWEMMLEDEEREGKVGKEKKVVIEKEVTEKLRGCRVSHGQGLETAAVV